jgi:hypothetical protein
MNAEGFFKSCDWLVFDRPEGIPVAKLLGSSDALEAFGHTAQLEHLIVARIRKRNASTSFVATARRQ